MATAVTREGANELLARTVTASEAAGGGCCEGGIANDDFLMPNQPKE